LRALADLTGPQVTWEMGPDAGHARVHADFSFDDVTDTHAFAVLKGNWSVEEGCLKATSALPPQIIWAIPLVPSPCSVAATVRTSGLFELILHDPFAPRLAGTNAVARIHFGRTTYGSPRAWVELSSGPRTLAHRYRFSLPDEPTSISLDVNQYHVYGRLSPHFDGHDLNGDLHAPQITPHVYVGLAAGVANTISVDALHIDGDVDLYSDVVDTLVGMGSAFWSGGRRVTLLFSGDGCFESLRHNGTVVAVRLPTDPPLATLDPPLRRFELTLRADDVLVFELSDADDFAALRVIGVDNATRRLVLASHPLTWTVASTLPSARWLTAPSATHGGRPHVARGQAPALREKFRAATGRDCAPLPLTGTPDESGHAWIKYVVQ
jgi:hypothetical protein